jgi:hypothetical protein
MTIMRYAFVVALAAASLLEAIRVAADNGPSFLVDAGQSGADPRTLFVLVLGGIALMTTFSLCRFVVFGLPSMLGSWCANNKSWIYTLLFGGIVWGAFHLF